MAVGASAVLYMSIPVRALEIGSNMARLVSRANYAPIIKIVVYTGDTF